MKCVINSTRGEEFPLVVFIFYAIILFFIVMVFILSMIIVVIILVIIVLPIIAIIMVLLIVIDVVFMPAMCSAVPDQQRVVGHDIWHNWQQCRFGRRRKSEVPTRIVIHKGRKLFGSVCEKWHSAL